MPSWNKRPFVFLSSNVRNGWLADNRGGVMAGIVS